MIREATEADIPTIVEWGAHFAEACNLPGGYDPSSAEIFFRHLIENPDGILLIGDGGAIGGMAHASPYNHAHKTGQELFWWVEPDKRKEGLGIALLKALQNAIEALGVHSWTLSTVGLDDGSLGQVYERFGYKLTDRNYSRTF